MVKFFEAQDWYVEFGRLSEQVFRYATEDSRPKESNTLGSMNHLTPALLRLGPFEETLSVAVGSLRLCQEIFGTRHLHTIRAMATLSEAKRFLN